MTRPTSPTVSRRWLALEMRRLRKERRLSQARVAKALGCQVPKVSLMETGQRPLHDADLPDESRHHYSDELENVRRTGWSKPYAADTAALLGIALSLNESPAVHDDLAKDMR